MSLPTSTNTASATATKAMGKAIAARYQRGAARGRNQPRTNARDTPSERLTTAAATAGPKTPTKIATAPRAPRYPSAARSQKSHEKAYAKTKNAARGWRATRSRYAPCGAGTAGTSASLLSNVDMDASFGRHTGVDRRHRESLRRSDGVAAPNICGRRAREEHRVGGDAVRFHVESRLVLHLDVQVRLIGVPGRRPGR